MHSNPSERASGRLFEPWQERQILAFIVVVTSVLNVLRLMYAGFQNDFPINDSRGIIYLYTNIQFTQIQARVCLVLLVGATAFWVGRKAGRVIAQIAWAWIAIEYAVWLNKLQIAITSVEVPSAFSLSGEFMKTGGLWDACILALIMLLLVFELRTA